MIALLSSSRRCRKRPLDCGPAALELTKERGSDGTTADRRIELQSSRQSELQNRLPPRLTRASRKEAPDRIDWAVARALYEVWIRDSTFSMGDAARTQIVMAGGTQPLIETNFFDGGMYVFNYQTFFRLRPRGPQMVDFSAVFEAAGKALPKGEEIHQPTTNYGIRQLRYQVGAFEAKYGFSKSVCCVGKVEVPYTIEDGIAKPVAGKTKYQGRVR